MTNILEQENRWFERGVRKAIHVHLENPSLSSGGGLRYNLSPTYHAALSSILRKIRTTHPRKTTVNVMYLLPHHPQKALTATIWSNHTVVYLEIM